MYVSVCVFVCGIFPFVFISHFVGFCLVQVTLLFVGIYLCAIVISFKNKVLGNMKFHFMICFAFFLSHSNGGHFSQISNFTIIFFYLLDEDD